MKGAILSLGAILFAAGAAVEPPRIGCLMTESGRVRILYGVAGTFLLGDADAGCEVELSSEDRQWTARRENGRWWLIQIDRDSGGETERVPLEERAWFAIPFGSGAAVTAAGSTAAYRGRKWELPADVLGLFRMSPEWVQIATRDGSYAIRPEQDHPPYLLPSGDPR